MARMWNGFNFLFANRADGSVSPAQTRESLCLLKEATASNTVALALVAYQDTPQSEWINYQGIVPTDAELKFAVAVCRELGLSVILKPMVDCKDGVWRAHINFFDHETPCEPKWSKWFENYGAYISHYAELAEEIGADMLIIGCELVQSERKGDYWRKLASRVRTIYSGKITYNTDKYQEDAVTWWDALDYISSSGYYPINEWDTNIDRIEKVVKAHGKPFFFAECGCMNQTGSSLLPNVWMRQGEPNFQEQVQYYQAMFEKAGARPWVEGFLCWVHREISTGTSSVEIGHEVIGKPASKVVKSFFESRQV